VKLSGGEAKRWRAQDQRKDDKAFTAAPPSKAREAQDTKGKAQPKQQQSGGQGGFKRKDKIECHADTDANREPKWPTFPISAKRPGQESPKPSA
jgi:hypothetical protein